MTEIVIGEAVPLDLPPAAFLSRVLALLIDGIIQLVVFAIILIPVIGEATAGNGDYATAIGLAGYAAVFIGYPAAFETLSRGKTLGKLALGLRVVGEDGGPDRFRQALVRALAGLFEIWNPLFIPVGLICALASPRGRRVGDVFAGTYVISERVPRPPALQPILTSVPPQLAEWARSAQVALLSAQAAEEAASYLRRMPSLSPAAQDSLGRQLAALVAAQVSPPPPPGTPPWAYLLAVLAVRRQRELAVNPGQSVAGQGAPVPVAPLPGFMAGTAYAQPPAASTIAAVGVLPAEPAPVVPAQDPWRQDSR